jgi:hypothetical protein
MPQVEVVFTPLLEVEFLLALRDGHTAAFGAPPRPPRLHTAMAQVALETGRGAKLKRNNFGNETTWGTDGGAYFELTGPEYDADDTPPTTKTLKYRVYATAADGAAAYWALLARAYPASLATFDEGDAAETARALKRAKYYSAPLTTYEAGMVSLYAEYARRFPVEDPGPAEGRAMLTEAELHAVLNLSHETLKNLSADLIRESFGWRKGSDEGGEA